MAGEWCVVLDAVSSKAARKLGDALGAEDLDVETDAGGARVWCYADERSIDGLLAAIRATLQGRGLGPTLQAEPRVRVWSATAGRYVDPESPGADPDSPAVWIASDLEPGRVGWLVRLELATPFELRRVRRQLPHLRRPVVGTGRRHVDVGARDPDDAARLALTARTFQGVKAVRTREVRGPLRRWVIRQRLTESYVDGPDGPGYDYPALGAPGESDRRPAR